MSIMNLTVSDIEQDIIEFEQRIEAARQQLAGLPEGHLSYPVHKKREKQRRDLQAEVRHYKQLVSYALEGVEIRLKEAF